MVVREKWNLTVKKYMSGVLTGFMVTICILFIQEVRPVGAQILYNDLQVTATRIERSIRDVPACIDIIDGKTITNMNVINIDELFKTQVGVDLQGSGFPGSEVKLNFRGLTSGRGTKRVLVLMDGRRLNDPYEGNTEFSLLPADAIDRIEIIRGPASALYGSNAVGGVIQIFTKNGKINPSMEVDFAAGTHGTFHTKMAHGWKKGDLDYFVTASHVVTEGYMNNADGTDRDFNAQNLTGNIGWRIGPGSELRMRVGGYFSEGTDDQSMRENRKDFQSITYKRNWRSNENAATIIRLYRNKDHYEYDWKYPGKGIYRLSTISGEVQQSLRVGSRHFLVAGFENRRDDADIDEVAQNIDKHTTVTAGYFQDEIYLTDRLQMTAGIRIDYDDDYGEEYSPHAGLLFRITPQSEAYVSANRAHRAPGLSDRYVKVVYWGCLFEGNPDLKPETVTSYEIGWRRRYGEGLKFELTGFYTKLKDTFDFMLEPDGVFRNHNVTEAKTFGVESSIKYAFNNRISGTLFYSYTDGTYEKFPQNPAVEGNRLQYLAKIKAGAGINMNFPDRTGHSLVCRYVGERFGDAQNSEINKMDDYFIVDWHLRFQVNENLRLTVNIDNLFDATYKEFPNLEQPGRTFLFGMEATF